LLVYYGTATLYGCTFTSNTASSYGPDNYNVGGTVAVNGDGAGYSNCVEGDSLDTTNDGGTLGGPLFSFSDCTTD